MISYLVLTVIVAVLIVILKDFPRKIFLASKIPGPPAWPLVGNLYMFYKKTPAETLKVFSNIIDKYGPVVRMWMATDLSIIMTDQKDVEAILSSQQMITKGSVYKLLIPWLGDGLLLSKGKKWHQRRKILTPAFHFKILEDFVETFDRQSQTLVEILSKIKPEEKTELYSYVTLYTLDVICETAMGTTNDAQIVRNSPYIQAVQGMAKIIQLRSFQPNLRKDATFNLSPLRKVQEDYLKTLHGFTDSVIQQRRQELIKMQNGSIGNGIDSSCQFGIKKKKAFLDILLQSTIEGQPLSNSDIREEVDTFMFEGHDTTTAGISFCLYNLAKYPAIQTKCFNEILQVIGYDKTESINYATLNNLQYLEKVIKETLRLYPPVPIMGRYITEDTVINGKTIPANSSISIPVYHMGQNEKYFENAKEFRPERFDIEKEGRSYPTFSYVPFSAGPRNCIGQKFAVLEMKSAISKILRYFEVSLHEDSLEMPALIPEVILRTDKSINYHLKPRVYP